MKKLAIIAVLLLVSTGCSSATRSRMFFNKMAFDYKVTLYSGGEAIGTWKTKGEVRSEGESDGYYFVDASTGKIVEIAGTLVIEQLP